MNDRARVILAGVVTRYGRESWEDYRRCEGILKDLCGDHPAEVAALVAAVKQRVPHDLAAITDGAPWEVVSLQYAKRLTQQLAVSDEASRWAVESWALALGRISDRETVRQAQTPSKGIPKQKVLQSAHQAIQFPSTATDQKIGGMFAIGCGNCQSKMRVPLSAAGKRGKCPRCGAMIVIPAPPESPPAILATPEIRRDFSRAIAVTPERQRKIRTRRRDEDEDEDDARDLRPRRREEEKGLSLASMILGIVAVSFSLITPCCWPVTGPIAVIGGFTACALGLFGLMRGGRGYAITGLILGVTALVLVAVWSVFLISVLAANPGRR